MRTRNIILVIFSLTQSICYGQYFSVGGTFSIAERKGCTPFTVNIIPTDPDQCDGDDPCVVDFEGNGQFQSLVLSHTYTQAGTYQLTILYQGGLQDNLQVEVFPDIQPAFDIYSCTNNEALINITDSNYDQYVIDYNDASPPVTVPSGSLAKDTHVFASSGNKTITVEGRLLNALNNCTPSNQSFNALQTLPTASIDTLRVLSGTQIQLEMSTLPHVQYRLEIAINGSASFQQLQTVYNQATPLVINNLNTETNFYCFRLGTFDPCTNTVIGYSNIICSARFSATAQNNVNVLTWVTSSAGLQDYSIPRNNQIYVDVTNTSLTSFNDIDIICKTNYCYQLVSNYTNGSKSYSIEKCATAFSTTPPTPIQNITAVVSQGGVTLEWTSDPAFTPVEHRIVRAPGGLIGTTASSPYTDADYTTDGDFCYQVTYEDACDNFSASAVDVCPIRLTATLNSNNSITLNWSAYTGWQNGVAHYIIEKYTPQGALLQTFNAGTDLTLTDDNADDNSGNQVYVYIVKANAVDAGLGQATSNPETIVKEPNLYYPTAFTPNNDNLNDVFKVFGQYIVDFEMKIFNRWGELLYTTNDMNQGWDGSYRGNEMPEGTYVFVAEITDLAGRTFNRSGSVYLIRKGK